MDRIESSSNHPKKENAMVNEESLKTQISHMLAKEGLRCKYSHGLTKMNAIGKHSTDTWLCFLVDRTEKSSAFQMGEVHVLPDGTVDSVLVYEEMHFCC